MGDKDHISESIVRLLFDQLKESDTQNKESIKELTAAITQLITVLGNNPAEAITMLKTVIEQQKTIIDNYSKLKWILGITITIIGITFTLIKALDWYAKWKPPTPGG